MSRIHHQLFMNEESVLEHMFLKVVQSRRFRTLILKVGPWNARTHFSHPPPRFYEWGECTRVYSFQTNVQYRLSRTLILKMWPCNARTHFSHPPPAFYEREECNWVYVFKISSVQTILHPNFENGTLQCEHILFASTTAFLWMRRVYQIICF